MSTIWFLIVLAMFPDHVHLERGPYPFATQAECSTEGNSYMIDRRNKTLRVFCIEADDEFDLHKIMSEAFNFGKPPVEPKGQPV